MFCLSTFLFNTIFISIIQKSLLEVCVKGKYPSDPDDSTSVCVDCPIGYYQDAEPNTCLSIACIPCAAGKYSTENLVPIASDCVVCAICTAGEHETTACTAATNRVCQSNTCTCPNGTPTVTGGIGSTLCDTNGQIDCSACDTGYTISATAALGSAQNCIANICTCPNGVVATGTACTSHGARICASCSNGYHPEGTTCIPWSGSCANGALIAQASRIEDNHCGSCSSGYTLSSKSCVANSCAASGNVANSDKAGDGSITGTTGTSLTVTCNTGYTGSGTVTCGTNGLFNTVSCIANTCTCPNGTPTIASGSAGTLCDTATVDCSRCNSGYAISATAAAASAQTCVAYGGSCSNGNSISQPLRTLDNHCGSCNAGYRLSGTTCSACRAFRYQSSSSFTGISCIAWTKCSAGTYGDTPTATANRICTNCLSGQFSAALKTSCTVWGTTCPESKYIAIAGTTIADIVCSSCTSTCTGENYEITACTSSSNRVCSPCTSACTGDTYETTACTSSSNRVCSSCTSACSGENYETTDCTSTTNRVCSSCTSACSGDTHETTPCTSHSNRVCSSLTECNAGTYGSTPTSTVNRVCLSCQTGFYQAVNGYADRIQSCTAWSTCGAGRYISASGSTSTDVTCSDCETGKQQISSTYSGTSCYFCRSGKKFISKLVICGKSIKKRWYFFPL